MKHSQKSQLLKPFQLLLILLLIGIGNTIYAQSYSQDEIEVRKTLNNYIEGRNNGNISQLKSAFHESADLRSMKNDTTLFIWPVKDYISIIKPGSKANCIARIISVDILGNGAQAKIELEYPDFKYADYINLLKMEEGWKIAVKSYSKINIRKQERILFVITSNDKKGNTGKKTGIHLGEVSHAYKPLHDAGFEIDFVSPKGGTTFTYGNDINDEFNLWFLQNPDAYYKFSHSMTPDEINPERYAAIYFVGGGGTMWDFPDNKELASITSNIYEQEGVVAGVCHGPAGLVNVKLSDGSYLIKGKELTSFTDSEEKAAQNDKVMPFLLETKLKERGAKFKGAANWQENVVVDGRLITGQNPASAHQLALEMIKVLKEKS